MKTGSGGVIFAVDRPIRHSGSAATANNPQATHKENPTRLFIEIRVIPDSPQI
jgi:hypothetical protein